MKRHFFIMLVTFWGITFGIMGCASVNPSIFKSQKKIENPILPLELHIVDTAEKPSVMVMDATKIFAQKSEEECRYILHREYSVNMISPNHDNYGYVIASVKRKESFNLVYCFISGLTALSINLLGFPSNAFTSEVDMEFLILDANKNTVAKYSSTGEDTEYSAIFWGYLPITANQVGNTRALLEAIDSLKDQLGKDSERINKQLMAVGPIKQWKPMASIQK